MKINKKHLKKNRIRTKKITKKMLIILIITITLVITATTGVYAYFTHKKSTMNQINLAYNKITVNENYIPPLNIQKGTSFIKEPYITNVGTVDCYVRIKSVVSDSRVEKYLTIDYNNTDYTYNAEDGYWYYKTALKPGEKSKSLFTTVKIAEDADDIVLDGFDIYVYAESIQTVEGKTMEEMW